MSVQDNKKSKNDIATNKASIARWLMIIVALIGVPLCTFIHKYDTELVSEKWYASSAGVYDFFLYYRSRLLLVIGVTLCVMLMYYVGTKKEKFFPDSKAQYIALCAGVYLLFTLASTLFAMSPAEAFWGGYEQFEGFICIFAYVMLFWFAYTILKTENELKLIVKMLIVGSFIIGLLGTLQAFNLDYMKSDFGHSIITMFEPELAGLQFKLSFGDGMAYATLYNPNYVGTYAALVVPVLAGACVWLKEIVWRVLSGISIVLVLITLYASQSFTGIIGIAGAIVLFLVFMIPNVKKHMKGSMITIGVCVVAAIAVLCVKPDFVKSFIDKMTQTSMTDSDIVIKDASLKKNKLTVETMTNEVLKVDITHSSDGQVGYNVDAKQTTVKTSNEGSTLKATTSKNQIITLQYERGVFGEDKNKEYDSVRLSADKSKWRMIWDPSEKGDSLKLVTPYGKFDKLRSIESVGFENSMRMASGRGYIWSHTFPLLLDNMFVGAGQDNFVYEFPNYDYIGKANYDYGGQIMTKPHNMYLQMWVQNGFIAFLGFLILVIIYIIDSIKLYFAKDTSGFMQGMGLCMLISVFGYMVTGLANDATICVTPVFWIILGLGFSVNRIVAKKRQQTAPDTEEQPLAKNSK